MIVQCIAAGAAGGLIVLAGLWVYVSCTWHRAR